MKKKTYKIFGVGLVVMMLASLLAFAAPMSAEEFAPVPPNMWNGYGGPTDRPVQGAMGGWFYDPAIEIVGPIAEAINGTLYAYVEGAPAPARTAGDIFKSPDGGRSWSTSRAPGRYSGGPVVDMVCSSLYEDTLYVTDGNYVYKSIDGGQNWMIVAKENLEYHLMGDCGETITGFPITCIDVGYDAADEPVVFIGTKHVPGRTYIAPHPAEGADVVGSVYWIADETFPAEWHDLQLFCYGCCDPTDGNGLKDGCFDVYAVGCDPGFANTDKTYALITTDDLACDGTNVPATRVVSTIGTTCSWSFVSELYWDCDVTKPFEIRHASRFAFPNDFADTHAMFIGVAGTFDDGGTPWDWTDDTYGPGGDVYRVVDGPPSPVAIDLNVQGYTTGCIGILHANICSLDMMGGTDDGSLIAGAYDFYQSNPAGPWTSGGTNVYYSNDGGWTWTASKKDPTGIDRTYVLWHGDSAVAGTRHCDCAFSMSCGDEIGEYWNQISLINTCIDCDLDLSHAPGYLDGASTMYLLTYCDSSCQWREPDESTSLFRWDGTYWERVYSSFTYQWPAGNALMDWVEVSPDFNTTGCLYMASTDFQMYRSIDAGCSWAALAYPCEPRPCISAWIVVDEETVLAAGCTADCTDPVTGYGNASGIIFKTTRHGTRPWTEIRVTDACCGVDFDLSPNIGADGRVLFGDMCGQVFISEDIGSTWDEVVDAVAPIFASACDPNDVCPNTYVQFDPGHGTSGDPGENMIYAAAAKVIGRCNINPDAPWMAQNWEAIKTDLCYASGIDAYGDTALYVSDGGYYVGDGVPPYVEGTMVVRYDCVGYTLCMCDLTIDGSTFQQLTSALPCNEPLEIVSYNLVCTGTPGVDGSIVVRGLISDEMIRIIIADIPLGGCFPCIPPGSGGVEAISGDITLVCEDAPADCPTGVWRTLNPMAPIPPAAPFNMVEFELLSMGLLSNTALFHTGEPWWTDDLWLTRRAPSSNVLWCLDYNNCDYVWVWDDPLANPVTLKSPACGAQLVSPGGVTLEWEALDGATLYEIEIYQYCPQCPEERLAIKNPATGKNYTSADTCLIVGGLAAGTKHYWRVRVALGHPYLSKWSELCTFTTALGPIPNLCSPPCGAEDVILTTNFSWDEVPGAASYQLQIVAAGADGTADFTGAETYTTDVNALASIPGLEYSTVYYWRVRAFTAGVPGAWAVCIFTTMDEPVEPLPPADLIVEIPAEEVITPTWIWVLIGIGAALTIAVIILIVTTRRVP